MLDEEGADVEKRATRQLPERESPEIIAVLRRLSEYETENADAMTCYDGGYRYVGDFASMEVTPLESIDDIVGEHRDLLLESGYIEEAEPGSTHSGRYRLTDLGRQVAHTGRPE